MAGRRGRKRRKSGVYTRLSMVFLRVLDGAQHVPGGRARYGLSWKAAARPVAARFRLAPCPQSTVRYLAIRRRPRGQWARALPPTSTTMRVKTLQKHSSLPSVPIALSIAPSALHMPRPSNQLLLGTSLAAQPWRCTSLLLSTQISASFTTPNVINRFLFATLKQFALLGAEDIRYITFPNSLHPQPR